MRSKPQGREWSRPSNDSWQSRCEAMSPHAKLLLRVSVQACGCVKDFTRSEGHQSRFAERPKSKPLPEGSPVAPGLRVQRRDVDESGITLPDAPVLALSEVTSASNPSLIDANLATSVRKARTSSFEPVLNFVCEA
jgi:hypothetical protein